MSCSYTRASSGLLCVACLVGLGASWVVPVQTARAEGASVLREAARLPRERTAFRLASYLNKSTWTATSVEIENVVFDRIVKDDPVEFDAVEATVEDSADARVKQIAVTAFEKNAFRVTRKLIMVDPSILAGILSVEPDLRNDWNMQSVRALVRSGKCPEPLQVDAVFATPYDENDPGDAGKAAHAALKSAKTSLETLQHLRVKVLAGEAATLENYVRWMKCDTVRYFSSIAPVEASTGKIALARGQFIPADWLQGFAEQNYSLADKVVFMNSDKAYSFGALRSAMGEVAVRTLLGPATELIPGNARDVFACFWRGSMTPASGLRYPRMADVITSCQAQYWEPGIYFLDGDAGPIMPRLDAIDSSRFTRPPLQPLPQPGRDPVTDPLAPSSRQ